MTRHHLHRLLVLPTLAASAALLTGCLPFAPPTPHSSQGDPAPSVDLSQIDPVAAERMMLDALPTFSEEYATVDSTGLDEVSFGSDWTAVDYDAMRVARVRRSTETPGWGDYSKGDSFWIDVEYVLMKDEISAAAIYNELAGPTSEPYSFDDETPEGTVRSDYTPMTPPSGRWPFGTAEQNRTRTWSNGVRVSGWVAYYLSGPIVVLIFAEAAPNNDSLAVLDAYSDEFVPELVAAVDALPEAFAAGA